MKIRTVIQRAQLHKHYRKARKVSDYTLFVTRKLLPDVAEMNKILMRYIQNDLVNET